MSNFSEAQFTTRFKTWILANKPTQPCVFEYKVSNGGTFNLKAWREGKQAHQVVELNNSTNEIGTYHKISDESSEIKPYDAFFMCKAKGFLVVYFNKYEQFFIISIHDELLKGDSLKYKDLKNPHVLISKKQIIHKSF